MLRKDSKKIRRQKVRAIRLAKRLKYEQRKSQRRIFAYMNELENGFKRALNKGD
jgi:hypothetical protein